MNSVTFRLLEVFKHVVENGSITGASARLSLSQPTVSLQLKKLTEIYGMPLLETHHGTINLTDAGKAVYQSALSILQTQEELNSHILALKGQSRGAFKLAVASTAKYLVPKILKPFCLEHPGINIHIKVGNSEQITDRIKQQLDDMYILSDVPEFSDIEARPFMTNKLKVVAPVDFDGPNHCHLNELLEHKFLIREQGSNTHKALQNYCLQNNINLTNIISIESNEAIQAAVSAGIGLAVLSEHTINQSTANPVKELNIIDFPLVNEWHAVSLLNRPKSSVSDAFREHLNQFGDLTV